MVGGGGHRGMWGPIPHHCLCIMDSGILQVMPPGATEFK